ncbi:dTDP-4-dehydrorhamnose 3,5-epimerase [Winogradskyella sp. PG-2]|uniref:dTDP-4-dehydrorhamnose 3,5-epimerase n=1 Tax=Winogradskyella sp. PG-2 TaxID=754409 RepID=UPI0004588306|nr:dTDP-4-dehydrorhamnose 3,5-epimerase [Winogradskyella sp. PG-2]BAO75574.1 dTDP-4-dehydrorhamnose 3,5-epimerase [Winogradskyella sp. PG-2]
MKIKNTNINGCFIIEPMVFEDQRGYFVETFNRNTFKANTGLDINFVQDNESSSKRGVLRGLHYQRGEFAQAKLVRVIQGSVLDIAVDLRKSSKTYGQYISVELSASNKMQLFVPRGFAHGFIVLSDIATFSYKCDNYYNKESEGGILYNDSQIAIDWQLPKEEYIISDKDLILPSFDNILL